MRLKGSSPTGLPSLDGFVGSPSGGIIGGIQGPPGPQGEQGPPGQGLEITGGVDTYADLPTDAADNEAFVVLADGKLYIRLNGAWPANGAGVPFKGDKGDTGATGSKGDTGEQGIQGVQGDPGIQGVKGDTGDEGPKGDKGDQGEQGEIGPSGGPVGPQGDQGPQGDPGPQGDKGDTGATGTQGLQGLKGDTGAQGAKGDQGDQGIQGVKGDQGIQGVQGDPGATTIAGISGLQGDLDALQASITSVTTSDGTKLNQTQVDARVAVGTAALVASAPTTLDTLNELATALGNDPHFATTVTNLIATKVGSNGTVLNVVALTQAAYTALGSKVATTLYVING